MEKLGKKKLDMQKLLAPAALVILYIVFSIFGNNFLSLDMVKNILESSYYIGFMAFGVTFIIITGGIDLSLGTVMMCAALLGGYVFKQGWPLILAIALTLFVGIAFGFVNGVLIAKLKLPPFIATLGTQMMSMGFGSIITKVQSQTWPTATAEVGGWFKKVFIRAELFGIKGFVKILSAPQGLLMPIILCMCCVGAFGCSNRMFDVWCLLIFGLIAVVIRAMELPIMPVAIGFILGPIFEKNLRRAESFMTSGPAELLHHPIALVILVITVVMIIFSLRSNKPAAEREAAAAAAEEQE